MTHIVLTGNAGSGKDTAGIFLSAELGIQRIAFADEVRDMMWELNIPLYDTVMGQITYRVAVETFGYDKAKRAFPDIRRTLDALATKIIRNLSLIHISEPTRPERISYAVFCLKKKK